LVLPHAVRQMSHPDRMISMAEVHRVIENGELVEDYPEDVRGYSCLILGQGERNRPIHVVCSRSQIGVKPSKFIYKECSNDR